MKLIKFKELIKKVDNDLTEVQQVRLKNIIDRDEYARSLDFVGLQGDTIREIALVAYIRKMMEHVKNNS